MNAPKIAHFDPFSGPPRIHGASRVGIRPGTEIIHPLAATGERPLRFEVVGLPVGVEVDSEGILRGTAPVERGEHNLAVTVTNAKGAATASVELVVGDTLALTPPMGWNSWNVYASRVSADVVLRTAQAMVDSGMRDLGYQYINIDDHWHAPERASDGRPVANSETFGEGIAALADAVHGLGLKLGIYSDAGTMTCGKCFGGYGYERIDAETYASWGVDLLKYDYCFAPSSADVARSRYTTMGNALKATNRSIVFSVCEWGFRKPWQWAHASGGSMWRTTPDIFDTFSWTPLGVRYIARHNLKLADSAGPGRWNDPDMLLVGNHGKGQATGVLRTPNQLPGSLGGRKIWSFPGISQAQTLSHMTLWAMMAAPLLASHDISQSSEFDLALLTNPEILAIDQDPLGAQGRLMGSKLGMWQVVKPLADGGFAVSVTNLTRVSRRITIDVEQISRSGAAPVAPGGSYEVTNAWTMQALGSVTTLRSRLSAHDSVVYVCRPTLISE